MILLFIIIFLAAPAWGETLCAEVTEHDQVPAWDWLDCESAQWLTGMAPSAHRGPVFPDGPGTAPRFVAPPTCTGGDGFTREENERLWMHDHGGVRDLPGTTPDESYHFQCPDVANPNWNKDGRKTHTYNTSEGLIFQGRNGAWCVEEGDTCNPDTVSPVLTHQQHRGPVLCQVKTPTKGGSITVHSGCDWEGCMGAEGIQRVRVYDTFGTVGLLGEFPAGNPLLHSMSWEGHKDYIFVDGKKDTTWVGVREVCVEVGCAESPDFDNDGDVDISDFVNHFMPRFETFECTTSDFVTWFMPAFMAETGN